MRTQREEPEPRQLDRVSRICIRTYVSFTIVALIALAATTTARGASQDLSSRAHAAGTLNVTDTAHLHLVKSPGASLTEEGTATGKLPGTVKATLKLGATVTATYTIDTHAGNIIGRGSGTLHGTGLYASFSGSITVTHGTGRYVHAHGTGGLSGEINRDTYAITVHTSGTLDY